MTALGSPTDVVGAYLEREAAAIDAAIFAALDAAEVDDGVRRLMAEYPRRPAKRLRPALCLATSRAFGGADADVMPSAAAIELLHNLFLVHDDVADASTLRRGEPTLHEMVGSPLALTTAGGLAVVAFGLLQDNYPRLGGTLGHRIADEFRTMLMRTVRGQAMDLAWTAQSDLDLEPSDYLDMVVHKTCWYTTIHPMRVGGLVGTWGTVDPDRFSRFGVFLGAAFQARDDLLSVVGDGNRHGKDPLGDLREGKRTLMLIRLAEVVTGDDAAVFATYLRTPAAERSPALVNKILTMMRDTGAIQWAMGYASEWMSEAERAFLVAFADAPPGPDLEFIRALIPYVVGRDS